MEMQENNQLELFSQSNASTKKQRSQGSSFFTRIRRYEKTILFMIAIIITSIVSFSFGVEKGRKVSQTVQPATKLVSIQVPEKQRLPERSQALPKPQSLTEGQKIQESTMSFTIQIASYKSKALAQKEAQALKKRGLNPTLLSKGGYNVLCVGNFSSKKEAQTMLTELKKEYAGCYIRRL